MGEESSKIHRSLARASSELYTHCHAPKHGLGFSFLHSMTMGTPPPGVTTRRVGGAGFTTVEGRYRYHGMARVRL
jgi:hypothetical protein